MIDVLTINKMTLKFARWLLVRRKDLGLKQEDLAEALGVSRTTISNWETGASAPSLSIEQTKILCRILQAPLEEIPSNGKTQP